MTQIILDSPNSDAKTKEPNAFQLPGYNVILHIDDHNDADFVLKKVMEIARLKEEDAIKKVKEAHETGQSILLTTHQEYAELLCEKFHTYKITATFEKA